MSLATQRIAWKENYLLRPITIANLIIFCIGLIGVWFLVPVGRHQSAAELCLGLFTLMSCVAALATGIILFVPERETGTDLLLGRLPINGPSVSRVKLKQGTIWFLLFLISAAIIGLLFYSIRYGANIFASGRKVYFGLLVIVPIECFLWSIICSIRSKHSITAVVVSAISAAVSHVVIAFVAYELLRWSMFRGIGGGDSMFLLIHVCLTIGLTLYAVVASRRWL